jgi:hypothetical protein
MVSSPAICICRNRRAQRASTLSVSQVTAMRGNVVEDRSLQIAALQGDGYVEKRRLARVADNAGDAGGAPSSGV